MRSACSRAIARNRSDAAAARSPARFDVSARAPQLLGRAPVVGSEQPVAARGRPPAVPARSPEDEERHHDDREDERPDHHGREVGETAARPVEEPGDPVAHGLRREVEGVRPGRLVLGLRELVEEQPARVVCIGIQRHRGRTRDRGDEGGADHARPGPASVAAAPGAAYGSRAPAPVADSAPAARSSAKRTSSRSSPSRRIRRSM